MNVKINTQKDYQERINRILLYIQENLDSSLNLEILAKVSNYSEFHFHKIFSAYVGETIYSYIKRVRLDNAAHKILNTKKSITEIALESGYDTSSSFSRVFKQYFGINPDQYRKINKSKSILNNSFLQNDTKEKISMEFRIVNLEDQKVIFVRKTGRYEKAASEAWSVLCEFALPKGIVDESTRWIGIGLDNPNITEENKLRYDACITINEEIQPEGEVGIQTIKGGRYAVFLHSGPYEGLAQVYNRIFSEWLPASGESLRDIHGFEVYLNSPRNTEPENLKTEIYIPIE